MDNDIPSISDQARSAAGGIPDANWGAKGTDGTPPPRSAGVYPPSPSTDPMLVQRPATNPNATVGAAVNGPLSGTPVQAAVPTAQFEQPAQPQFQTRQPQPQYPDAVNTMDPNYQPAPQYPAEQPAPAPSSEDRLSAVEGDIQKIAGAMGTLFEKIDQVLSTQNSVQAPVQAEPGMPTNTGQLGAYNPMPGVATPSAPVSHTPGVQGPIPRQTGNVIPAPVPGANQNVGQKKVARIAEDEADLTVAQYVEKHFRLRDQSIDEIAELLRLDPKEVTDILKELGYQFPDGV